MEKKMMGWNTPEDYLAYVHPYWRTFEAPNPFLHYTLGFFYIIFMFCALAGNGVVIWVFTRYLKIFGIFKKKKNAINYTFFQLPKPKNSL